MIPDPDAVQGVPGDVARTLEPMLGVDSMGYPLQLYSCIGRPGSWEWALPGAAAARRELARLGYRPGSDPSAPWRVLWTPPGRL
jgi:hypothetical protein